MIRCRVGDTLEIRWVSIHPSLLLQYIRPGHCGSRPDAWSCTFLTRSMGIINSGLMRH